jgi:hypothetical protein
MYLNGSRGRLPENICHNSSHMVRKFICKAPRSRINVIDETTLIKVVNYQCSPLLAHVGFRVFFFCHIEWSSEDSKFPDFRFSTQCFIAKRRHNSKLDTTLAIIFNTCPDFPKRS